MFKDNGPIRFGLFSPNVHCLKQIGSNRKYVIHIEVPIRKSMLKGPLGKCLDNNTSFFYIRDPCKSCVIRPASINYTEVMTVPILLVILHGSIAVAIVEMIHLESFQESFPLALNVLRLRKQF